ncbi:hypothetical protein U1Q18_007781 [Sarracenia purpurea var. burkii]
MPAPHLRQCRRSATTTLDHLPPASIHIQILPVDDIYFFQINKIYFFKLERVTRSSVVKSSGYSEANRATCIIFFPTPKRRWCQRQRMEAIE